MVYWRQMFPHIVLTLALVISSFGLVLPAQSALALVDCETIPSPPANATTATPVASTREATFPEEGGELRVFAAASLVDAFGQIADDLEATYPNLNISIETAGSQSLVTQLQEGATADVLATANASTMTIAVDSGLIEGQPQVFTGNRLVIVTPEDNPAHIASLDDLAGAGIHLVLAGKDVPAGSYTREALCAYDASGNAPDGFTDGVNANVVSEEVNVRSVLAKVQLGEADAGIVYASDAAAANLAGTPLTVIEFPETLDVTAVYPIAPIAEGNIELSQAFIAYILSEDGQSTLESFGFIYP